MSKPTMEECVKKFDESIAKFLNSDIDIGITLQEYITSSLKIKIMLEITKEKKKNEMDISYIDRHINQITETEQDITALFKLFYLNKK